MKRKIQVAKKLTAIEEKKVQSNFYMQEWEFDKLIGNSCTEITSALIGWKGNDCIYVHVYGLNAVYTSTKKPCIANFYIKFRSRVYQEGSIMRAAKLVELLEKELKYDQYQDQLWKEKAERRKAAKVKKEGSVKRLRLPAAKVA